MKLCKDCKHCVSPSIFSLALCGHEKAERSPYDGWLVEGVHFARMPNGICGPDAKLFEQREPEPPKVYFTEAMDPNKWPAAPGGICFEKYRADTGRPWWRRIFGG
jgi:hypothetical protein